MNGHVPRKYKNGGRRRCRCRDICRRAQTMRSLFRQDLPLEARKFIKSLLNDLCCAEADADYFRCVLSGDWPTAVEQLTAALEQAKRKEAVWKS